MLDNFLEPNILNVKLLLTLLLSEKEMTLDNISQQTSLSIAKIKYYCSKLNTFFADDLQFIINKSKVSCYVLQDKGEEFYFKIFNLSDTLNLLKFLLTNNLEKPITVYAEENFISNSKAYRIVTKLKTFLNTIGLDINNNTITGEEFRIRFLIALLHHKYGIVIYQITSEDLEIIHSFIFKSSIYLKKPSKALDKRFHYFDILLALSWKRKQYPVKLPKNFLFEQLKEIPIFDKLKLDSSEIEKRTKFTFNEGDFDYLYLIYLVVDNSFYSHYWTEKNLEQLFILLKQYPTFYELMNRIEKTLNYKIALDKHISCLIPLFRRTLFNLQSLITIDDYYTNQYQGNILFLQKIKEEIGEWLINNRQSNEISPGHLHLLCLYLEQLLEETIPPTTITIIEDKSMVGDLFTHFITTVIPTNKIIIYRKNILLENAFDNLKTTDFIVTSERLLPLIKESDNSISKSVAFGLSLDFIKDQHKTLIESITQLRHNRYQILLNNIFTKNNDIL